MESELLKVGRPYNTVHINENKKCNVILSSFRNKHSFKMRKTKCMKEQIEEGNL